MLRLTNWSRVYISLLCGGIGLLMFAPAIFLSRREGVSPLAFWITTVCFLGFIALTGLRGLLAWHTLEVDGGSIILRRIVGSRRYGVGDVKRVRFLTGEAPPSETPPTRNSVVTIKMIDGASYRGEVQPSEARELASHLAASASERPPQGTR